MQLTCQLKGTYQDIRTLRKLRGMSVKALAEQTGRKESYLYDLENGKVNLTLDDYHWYLSLLGFNVSVQTSITTEEILNSIETKGTMYMKQSRRELAKQVLIHYLEAKQEEWCAEGLAVMKVLLDYLDQKDVHLQLIDPNYAVYDGTDGGTYERVGEVFTLDLDGFADDLIQDSDEVLEERWSIQTTNGCYLDFYHLLSAVEVSSHD